MLDDPSPDPGAGDLEVSVDVRMTREASRRTMNVVQKGYSNGTGGVVRVRGLAAAGVLANAAPLRIGGRNATSTSNDQFRAELDEVTIRTGVAACAAGSCASGLARTRRRAHDPAERCGQSPNCASQSWTTAMSTRW
ncbi:hypothetical protein [Nocardioides deserti]|uniref:Uncharacterized protein n=1 Tax=Nocardioides deserti TaxID=1588644 RepID=A0ABR6U4M4_9ACTN|nr:hypothetical protein [Nocardioides deserti]MBC2959359.1 hypothetical protein [Nocardioides deserti]GGO73264.1 hypothetical protein GCM10012276_18430 [Nocardioides deserti]